MAAFTTGRAPQSDQVSINAEGSPVDERHQFEPAPKWATLEYCTTDPLRASSYQGSACDRSSVARLNPETRFLIYSLSLPTAQTRKNVPLRCVTPV
jgi:hypothetical protein